MRCWNKRAVLTALLMTFACVAGCALEDGFNEGLADGVSSAMAAVIQAPFNFLLGLMFPTGG